MSGFAHADQQCVLGVVGLLGQLTMIHRAAREDVCLDSALGVFVIHLEAENQRAVRIAPESTQIHLVEQIPVLRNELVIALVEHFLNRRKPVVIMVHPLVVENRASGVPKSHHANDPVA